PHRHGQHIAQPETGVRLVGRLAVDADTSLGHQGGAVAAGSHETRAPQPLVQALPVAVFLFRHAAYRFNAASAAKGPFASIARVVRAGGAARRRRIGASIAGAGGPNISGASPPPGTMRNPSARKMIGSNSARTDSRDPRSRGSMIAPRRVR